MPNNPPVSNLDRTSLPNAILKKNNSRSSNNQSPIPTRSYNSEFMPSTINSHTSTPLNLTQNSNLNTEIDHFDPDFKIDYKSLPTTSSKDQSLIQSIASNINITPKKILKKQSSTLSTTSEHGEKEWEHYMRNTSLQNSKLQAAEIDAMSSIGLENFQQFLDSISLDKVNFKAMHPISGHNNAIEITKVFLYKLISILLSFIEKSNNRNEKVLQFKHPHETLNDSEFNFDLDELTCSGENDNNLEKILEICEKTLGRCVKTGHPRYMNQLSCGLDIVTLAADWLLSTANTNNFTYEIAPMFVITEDICLEKMRQIIGWPINDEKKTVGDGIFSPGGSVNNLIAALLARNHASPAGKNKGVGKIKPLVMFVSEHAHYSNSRTAMILGIGSENVIKVPVHKSNGKMDVTALKKLVEKSVAAGQHPFLVVATAGTTVMGAFDPLEQIADVCQEHKLWLHIDAAWGGAVLLSRKYRHLARGIERADSVTWNPHKLMGVVLQCSALLVKDSDALNKCNKMEANYLFQPDKHYDVSYDTGDKTIQLGWLFE